MEKKNLDWCSIGFGYIQTDKRYVSNYKDGAWDEGGLTARCKCIRLTSAQAFCSTHRLYLKV